MRELNMAECQQAAGGNFHDREELFCIIMVGVIAMAAALGMLGAAVVFSPREA